MIQKGLDRQVDYIMSKINKQNLFKRYIMLLLGCLIVAFAFNVFFEKYNIVCFGVSGISIVLKEFGVEPSTFILVANIFLIIISYFFLGIDDVKKQIIGALIYPLFIKLTLPYTIAIEQRLSPLSTPTA